MGWLRITLTDDERRKIVCERESHPSSCVRRRLQVIWSLHCGLTRELAAKVAGVAKSSVARDVRLYRNGGVDALLKSGREYKPTSELAQYENVIRESLEIRPVRTIAEACQRIKELTGVERQPSQVRHFLKRIGLKWQRVRAIPVPPKKVSKSMLPSRPNFLKPS